MTTRYVEIVFMQGDDTQWLWDAIKHAEKYEDDTFGDVVLDYARQWDYGDDAPENFTREEIEENMGLGWSIAAEDEWGLLTYHWNHDWVAYYRKEQG